MTTEQKAKAWDLLREANLNISRCGGLFGIRFGNNAAQVADIVLWAMKKCQRSVQEHPDA